MTPNSIYMHLKKEAPNVWCDVYLTIFIIIVTRYILGPLKIVECSLNSF